MAEQLISVRLSTYSYSGITLHSLAELPLPRQFPQHLNPRQFRQHLTNLMSMNSLFLSDIFSLLLSRNFATMAHNNFSSLFSFKINSTTQKYLFLRAMRREHWRIKIHSSWPIVIISLITKACKFFSHGANGCHVLPAT